MGIVPPLGRHLHAAALAQRELQHPMLGTVPPPSPRSLVWGGPLSTPEQDATLHLEL